MRNVSLTIPDDVYNEVNSNVKLQTIFAIGMFVTQEVSLVKAAQLAGQNLVEFMDTLKGLRIPVITNTDELLLDNPKPINETSRCIIDEACGMLAGSGFGTHTILEQKRLEKELEYGAEVRS